MIASWPGPDPAIHVDARIKSGHDDGFDPKPNSSCKVNSDELTDPAQVRGIQNSDS